MTLEDAVIEVMNSDLSDDAKITIMKELFGKKETTYIPPYQITYPYIIQETPVPQKNWWEQITCKGWDDSGWWQQQQRNAQADVESIIHPIATW